MIDKDFGYCCKHGKVPDIYDGVCPVCYNHLTTVPVDHNGNPIVEEEPVDKASE